MVLDYVTKQRECAFPRYLKQLRKQIRFRDQHHSEEHVNAPRVVPVSFPHSSSPPAPFFPVPHPVPGVATLLLKRRGSIIGSPGPAVFVFTTRLLCSKSKRRSAHPESGFRVSSFSVLSIRPFLVVC
ncbi:hypothetical protein NDU88_001060 [Pleurodeles waltl]|uniref:Uncharacterized protein n=1 Tax=Pleurodeles waltl TaxID=8319 RepID=A0AAV7L8E0_PLEWA|nr:hypothetical protein NDU88_001060 [Pleurodeles waltl]